MFDPTQAVAIRDRVNTINMTIGDLRYSVEKLERKHGRDRIVTFTMRVPRGFHAIAPELDRNDR